MLKYVSGNSYVWFESCNIYDSKFYRIFDLRQSIKFIHSECLIQNSEFTYLLFAINMEIMLLEDLRSLNNIVT